MPVVACSAGGLLCAVRAGSRKVVLVMNRIASKRVGRWVVLSLVVLLGLGVSP